MKDIKDTINTLLSLQGQSTQNEIFSFLDKNEFSPAAMSLSYSIVINDDGTIDITVRDIHRITDPENSESFLPIAIENKMVFRLNKQNGNEYVPITPLETQVNVYDADVLVEDNKNDGYKEGSEIFFFFY